MSGLLVALEGIDGSGKSTLLEAVADELTRNGVRVTCTFEPGGSDLGVQLRPLLLDGDLDARTQLLLFAAERARHVRKVIRPALRDGAVVLCDRFEASTIAYQAHWLGLSETDVRAVTDIASDRLHPHLTVWVDAPPALAQQRRGAKHPDRLDAAAQAAGAVISSSFSRQAAADPERWLRVAADAPLDAQAEQVASRITAELAQRQSRGTLMVVAGPSGAGKNTIVERLVAARSDITFSVSATTRPPRPGERDGHDYHFVTGDAFDQLVASGGMLEWAEYAGHRYGTPRAELEAALEAGRHVVAIVELSGVEQIRAVMPDAPVVFVTAHPDELEARLNSRGSETGVQRERRLQAAREELRRGPTLADLTVDGGDAEGAASQLARLLRPTVRGA